MAETNGVVTKPQFYYVKDGTGLKLVIPAVKQGDSIKECIGYSVKNNA